MRRFMLSIWMVVLLVGALPGQTAEWKTYKSAEGNFSVQFPGDPQDSVNPTDGSFKSHILQLQQKPMIYMLVWTQIEKTQAVDNTNYEAFKNGVFSKLAKCAADSEQPASPSFPGYIGNQYLLSCDFPQGKVKIKGNLYWGKHYAFAVMDAFPDGMAEPAEARQFVKSFAVLDTAK